MTQIMLVQTNILSYATLPLVFEPIDAHPGAVSGAAALHFPAASTPTWRVRPHDDEMDSLADEARTAVMEGRSIRDTELGRLLHEAVKRGDRFCLFWASDFTDLPAPTTEGELFAILTEQLSSDGSSNWELYALWGTNA